MARLLYGILSAVTPAPTVSSLVDALGPDAQVLIHHDWSQQPEFSLHGPNVDYVPDPVRTGWATWGATLAVFRMLETALERYDFDYFQLMTPNCLPIRPASQLADHLARTGAAFYVDHVSVEDDPIALMSHGYRAFAPADSIGFRVLLKLRQAYFGRNPPVENRANLAFPTANLADAGGARGALARAARLATELTARYGFWHPFGPKLHCHFGCSWFGASREGCEYLLDRSRDRQLIDWFSRVSMPGEILLPTLIANAGMPVAPSNYLLSRFDGARPVPFGMADFDTIRASARFFARKFPEDPISPIRLAVKRQLLAGRADEAAGDAAAAPIAALSPRSGAGTT
ncbi:MAG: beta-1,6-N-acetylglucosaminyltransferase [Lautropia sp.]